MTTPTYEPGSYQEAPIAGTETEHIVGSLERQRAIFAWKCSGLDAAGLQAALAPSTITLGGLLKHLALVEDTHFQRLLLGSREITGEPWDGVDWDTDPDWEWHSAAENSPAELMALWQAAAKRSRDLVATALREGALDQLGAYVNRDGQRPSLRRIMLDMIEEYARHVGQADLIRESVDGLVGEDPPR